MSVQSTMKQILLRIKDFGTTILCLGTLFWSHMAQKNNDIDSKYIFKHTLSIQKCQFHRKMPFQTKGSSACKYTIQGYSADPFSKNSCQISIQHCHKS